MVKELDGAAADVSWHRRWMRVYEHHAAMFLTPQQWGLDGEIVLALPLQGLVVANVEGHSKLVGEQSQHGQVAEPFSPASREESALQTARNGQVQGAVYTPLSLSPCALGPLALSLLTLVGHVTALELRLFGPRFDGYGPWAHAY